jgi:uncharacterized BrkB/YihY/UPF0761 family membrane protein
LIFDCICKFQIFWSIVRLEWDKKLPKNSSIPHTCSTLFFLFFFVFLCAIWISVVSFLSLFLHSLTRYKIHKNNNIETWINIGVLMLYYIWTVYILYFFFFVLSVVKKKDNETQKKKSEKEQSTYGQSIYTP